MERREIQLQKVEISSELNHLIHHMESYLQAQSYLNILEYLKLLEILDFEGLNPNCVSFAMHEQMEGE